MQQQHKRLCEQGSEERGRKKSGEAKPNGAATPAILLPLSEVRVFSR
jgi:hypothetical protein